MEERTCYEMVLNLWQRFSSMLCFFHFCISSKYNFHVNAERMVVKTLEMKEIPASMV